MGPHEREVVVWKENYFMRTVNIYEPRGPKYHCSECNEVFNTRLSILTHSKMHLKPFCIVCGMYTQNVQEMQSHMKCDHRSMVEVLQIRGEQDINQNLPPANYTNVKEEKIPPKKQKTQKRTPFGFNGQPKSDKHPTKCVVSRFGRCINVKIPDY